MINSFNTFEDYLKNNADYIVGNPSGEVIYVTKRDINKLRFSNYIKYVKDLGLYLFYDTDYRSVMNIINSDKNDTDNNYIVEFFDKQKNVRKFKINKDSSVDVYGDIDISNWKLFELPFKFNTVEGDFISFNNSFINLENFPKHVMGNFNVRRNCLNDLYGGPTYVGENYDCSDNFINSLEHMPKRIFGNLDISNNLITNFDYSPSIIDGDLICYNNPIENYNNTPKCNKIINKK